MSTRVLNELSCNNMERSFKPSGDFLISKQIRKSQQMNIRQGCEVKDSWEAYMLLLYFIWIVFLYKSRAVNCNMGDEYILVNSMQGSFHQGNVEKFGDTTGRQCTCMALFAIAYGSFKRLGIWKKCDLDVILMNGDMFYKSLYRTNYLSYRFARIISGRIRSS